MMRQIQQDDDDETSTTSSIWMLVRSAKAIEPNVKKSKECKKLLKEMDAELQHIYVKSDYF